MFSVVDPLFVDVAEAAEVAWQITGVAGICKHEILCLVASVPARFVNARAVKQFFYNALSLSALPVPLPRQVSSGSNYFGGKADNI